MKLRSVPMGILALLFSIVWATADPAQGQDKHVSTATAKMAAAPLKAISAEDEAEALAFVREHHPELATVLEALKPMDPNEFQKAITELLQVSRNLASVKTRNPQRYELSLEAWKAKSRVELTAAQLAGSPSEELRSRLRTTIEAKIDTEIRRQRFELEQAEAAAKRARETLDRLETNRQSIIEARLRALAPKKNAKPKKPNEPKPSVTPSSTPTSNPPANPPGEDR